MAADEELAEHGETLDEIINKGRGTRRTGRGRGRGGGRSFRGRGGRGVGKRYNNNNNQTFYTNRLFVENLNFSTTWQTLKDFFRTIGKVKRADVLMNSQGESSGMGFIDFVYPSDVFKAIDTYSGTMLDDRPIHLFTKQSAPGYGGGARAGGFGMNNRRNFNTQRGGMSGLSGLGHNSNCKVWVGNMNWDTNWQSLKDVMRTVGDVKFVQLFEDDMGRPKGSAIVEFATEQEARNAIEQLHDTVLHGRPLIVREDKESGTSEFSVFVGNIPWAWQWQELKDLCKTVGNPTFVDIPQQMGRSRGYGIVKFATEEEGRACIEALNGVVKDGRELEVREDRR